MSENQAYAIALIFLLAVIAGVLWKQAQGPKCICLGDRCDPNPCDFMIERLTE